MKRYSKGFTLIELLVVISIISLLSSVVFSALNSARSKSRDSQRIQALLQVRTALELYYNANKSYPITSGTIGVTSWRGAGNGPGVNCTNFNPGNAYTLTGASGYIPSLAPTYMASLPVDPYPKTTTDSCYVYTSDGVDYKFLAYNSPENPANGRNFIDPQGSRLGLTWAIWSSNFARDSW